MSLVIERVMKVFATRRMKVTALDDMNLTVGRGEFVCIVGPSGCGKSTLLNLVAGLEKATSGHIRLNDREISGAGTDRAVIFQEAALFPWLKVLDNVEFGMKMAGVDRETRREKALRYLQMVHLAKFRDSWVHELSGGMKQRVAIARALALDSEVLLMDEPFAALDNQTRRMLQAELLQIWQETGKTIVFVTHSVEEAVLMADRAIVMTAGPGRVKREVRIDIPRPRTVKNPAVMQIVNEIARDLGSEVERIVKMEQDSIDDHEEVPVLPVADRNMGIGV